MKRILLASAIALWVAPSAAADLTKAPQPAVYTPLPAPSWAGLYVSGYGLYGANLANSNLSDTAGDTVTASTNAHGPGAGGAVGYNFQVGGGVLGVRADLAWLNMSNSATLSSVLPSTTNPVNGLGDVDLLVGLPFGDGRALGYAVGGFAYGFTAPTLQTASLSATPTGWNLGAGLAYQLTPNWIGFIEGDYYQLGDTSQTTGGITSTAQTHVVVSKAGLSYRF